MKLSKSANIDIINEYRNCRSRLIFCYRMTRLCIENLKKRNSKPNLLTVTAVTVAYMLLLMFIIVEKLQFIHTANGDGSKTAKIKAMLTVALDLRFTGRGFNSRRSAFT